MASEYGVFKCFIRGLDRDTNEADLEKAFSKFGNVVYSKIICDRETGKARGFGFVSFEDEKSMRDAIKGMNGPQNTGFQCFVHGLGCDTNAKGLEMEFSMFGEVIDVQIAYDRDTGISRGFGFVTFKDEKSMKDAVMLMDGDEIDGCYINVEEAGSEYGIRGRSIVRRRFGDLRFKAVEEAWPRKPTSEEFARTFSMLISAKRREMELKSVS